MVEQNKAALIVGILGLLISLYSAIAGDLRGWISPKYDLTYQIHQSVEAGDVTAFQISIFNSGQDLEKNIKIKIGQRPTTGEEKTKAPLTDNPDAKFSYGGDGNTPYIIIQLGNLKSKEGLTSTFLMQNIMPPLSPDWARGIPFMPEGIWETFFEVSSDSKIATRYYPHVVKMTEFQYWRNWIIYAICLLGLAFWGYIESLFTSKEKMLKWHQQQIVLLRPKKKK